MKAGTLLAGVMLAVVILGVLAMPASMVEGCHLHTGITAILPHAAMCTGNVCQQ